MDASEEIPPTNLRYFDLAGYAEIGVNAKGNLTVTLFDANHNPINQDDPLVFLPPLKLTDIKLLAAFTRESFELDRDIIAHFYPEVKIWEDGEVPTVDDMAEMNPSGKPGGN